VVTTIPGTSVIEAIWLYTVLAAFIIYTFRRCLPGPGMDHANLVRLGRAILIVPVATLTFLPLAPNSATTRRIITVSAVAMLLNGVEDGVFRKARCNAYSESILDGWCGTPA